MDDKSLLELCIQITGAFESGIPSYTTLTGNFDGQGMSAGILQWNAGQGTLQQLVANIGTKMGWVRAQSFFRSDIHHFAVLAPKEGIRWCLDHYIKVNSTAVDPAASQCWSNFLSQPESVAAQVEIATNTHLARAKTLADKFCPAFPARTRVIAFFFDLVVQSGGMENAKGRVDPLPSGQIPNVFEAIAFARLQSLKCAAMWEVATQSDDLAKLLLYYAYRRSQLSNPTYIWDALSRRGSIACRTGIAHATTLNFTGVLD